jgi:ABC-type Fe2+-enterobactin transport system substrate-binding protein
MTLLSLNPEVRAFAKPLEEVARAIYLDRNGAGAMSWSRLAGSHKAPYRADAQAALKQLRALGFINDIGLAAIKAEKAE